MQNGHTFGRATSFFKKKKVKVVNAVSSPLDRSKRFTLFALPDRPVHSDTNSASNGSILVMQQLRANTKSLTFPPLSMARYSFIQLSQQGRQWREQKCPIFETVPKRDSNPGLIARPAFYSCATALHTIQIRLCCYLNIHFVPETKTARIYRVVVLNTSGGNCERVTPTRH